jgi:hypothetical protein
MVFLAERRVILCAGGWGSRYNVVVTVSASQISLERMVNAVEKVRQRLLRAAAALRSARIPYAVAGGNAVAAWVSTVDEAAVRNTQDVDILIRREDLPAVVRAMESAGFVHRHAAGIDVFLDGPNAKPREAVHIVFAKEMVKPRESVPAPDVTESRDAGSFRILDLEALVRVKLTAFRDKDRTHLRDLIDVGLIDPSWPAKFPPELGGRLQHLLDTPEG